MQRIIGKLEKSNESLRETLLHAYELVIKQHDKLNEKLNHDNQLSDHEFIELFELKNFIGQVTSISSHSDEMSLSTMLEKLRSLLVDVWSALEANPYFIDPISAIFQLAECCKSIAKIVQEEYPGLVIPSNILAERPSFNLSSLRDYCEHLINNTTNATPPEETLVNLTYEGQALYYAAKKYKTVSDGFDGYTASNQLRALVDGIFVATDSYFFVGEVCIESTNAIIKFSNYLNTLSSDAKSQLFALELNNSTSFNDLWIRIAQYDRNQCYTGKENSGTCIQDCANDIQKMIEKNNHLFTADKKAALQVAKADYELRLKNFDEVNKNASFTIITTSVDKPHIALRIASILMQNPLLYAECIKQPTITTYLKNLIDNKAGFALLMEKYQKGYVQLLLDIGYPLYELMIQLMVTSNLLADTEANSLWAKDFILQGHELRRFLKWAIENSKSYIIKMLYQNHPDLFEGYQNRQKISCSLLHLLIEKNAYTAVKLLLACGINANTVDGDGKTPLMYAFDCAFDHSVNRCFTEPYLVKAMLQQADTIDMTYIVKKYLKTLFEEKEYDLATLVITKNKENDYRDEDGNTHLFWAACHADDTLFQLLLEKAPHDINVQNAACDTPLSIAVFTNQLAKVDMLLKAHCQLEIKNSEGNTPLMLAVIKNLPEMTLKLLKAGANINGVEGTKTLAWAKERGHKKIVDYIKQHRNQVSKQSLFAVDQQAVQTVNDAQNLLTNKTVTPHI